MLEGSSISCGRIAVQSAVKKIRRQTSHMNLLDDFVSSSDSLRVYHCGKLIFSSTGEALFPLVKYLDSLESRRQHVVI